MNNKQDLSIVTALLRQLNSWLLVAVCVVMACFNIIPTEGKRSFKVDYERNCFVKDGNDFRYISGSMHYFRVPSYYWEDRLKKMRAAGLNAVESYVAWQVHETYQGEFDFKGDNDIFKFISLAQKNDLLVILRPGPFIDAERDFGGLPFWLLKKKDIILRSSKDEFYLNAVKTWFSVLFPKLKEYLYINGGPIIMMQVENEYGSYYACDKVYLEFLRSLFLKYFANDVVLFSVDDGFRINELECGSLPSLLKTVDFGPDKDVKNGFVELRKIQPKGPLVNSEYYTGHLDHWGEPHQTRSTDLVVEKLDMILKQNASVNMYMFEGGTSFGYMNGAEMMDDGSYKPEPTSYDFDAPLSEAGDPTEKYYAIRKLISKYERIPQIPVPGPTPKSSYGKVILDKAISLFDSLTYLVPNGPVRSKYPKTMEDIGQPYGFILYVTKMPNYYIESKHNKKMELFVEAFHDRSVLFVDRMYQVTVNRSEMVKVSIDAGQTLAILVENQGRINYKYGSFTSLNDPKGIIGNATINGEILEDWEMFPLPLDNLHHIPWHQIVHVPHEVSGMPAFYHGNFSVTQANDTFLKTAIWRKGQAFVNNYNIGRYWPVMGPQETLFIPKNIINEMPHSNQVTLFEIDKIDSSNKFVEFVDKPIWKKFD